MSDNLELWNKVARPPAEALKKIEGGRLSGMSEISPQWRIKIMTEQFGPIGTRWGYSIDRLWTEAGSDDQVCAFASITVWYGDNRASVPGVGGSMLVAKEKGGPYTSDECYKMAVTDALGVALKSLGVAADIYFGKWDGSKYRDEPTKGDSDDVTKAEVMRKDLMKLLQDKKMDKSITTKEYDSMVEHLGTFAHTTHAMTVAQAKLNERFKK